MVAQRGCAGRFAVFALAVSCLPAACANDNASSKAPVKSNASGQANKHVQEDPRKLEEQERQAERRRAEQARKDEERARQQERRKNEEARKLARREEEEERQASRKSDWCGPEICYSQDGASCFERYRADYCMHIVYICMKNILGGCKRPSGESPPSAPYWGQSFAASSYMNATEKNQLLGVEPPRARRSAADWAAAASSMLLATCATVSGLSRLTARKRSPWRVDLSPLLAH